MLYFILAGIASVLILMGGAVVDRLRAIEHELAETRHLHAIRALWQTGACSAGWWESMGAPQIEKMAGCDPQPVGSHAPLWPRAETVAARPSAPSVSRPASATATGFPSTGDTFPGYGLLPICSCDCHHQPA